MKIEKIGLYYNRKDVVAVKSIIELPGNFLAYIDSAFNLKHYIGKQMEIFVGNLPFNITEREIIDTFAKHGEVSAVKMLKDKQTGRFRGIAFVTMPDDSQANVAIEALNNVELGGRPMRVDRSRERVRRFNGFGGGFRGSRRGGGNFGSARSRPRKEFGGDGRGGSDSESGGIEDADIENGGRRGDFRQKRGEFRRGRFGDFRKNRGGGFRGKNFDRDDEDYGEDFEEK